MKTNNQIKVTYKELSTPLKVAVIAGWIVLVVMFVEFMVGFIIGVAEL